MKITQVTVSYGETQSLPEYSNVKPSLTLTATLDEGDDPRGVELWLWEQAKNAVHAQIDTALEANGKAAKYDPCQRYQVMRTYWDRYNRPKDEAEPPKIVIIVPNELNMREQFGQRLVHAGYPESRNLRYHHAWEIAVKEAHELGAKLLDCSKGNIEPLVIALTPTVQEQADAAMDAIEAEREGEAAERESKELEF